MALVAHDRVLLVHRHPSRQNFPDLWDLPGGHVEDGEDWSDAAARECLEELGVGVKNLLQVPVGLAIPGVERTGIRHQLLVGFSRESRA